MKNKILFYLYILNILIIIVPIIILKVREQYYVLMHNISKQIEIFYIIAITGFVSCLLFLVLNIIIIIKYKNIASIIFSLCLLGILFIFKILLGVFF
jgi:hypothetical protein